MTQNVIPCRIFRRTHLKKLTGIINQSLTVFILLLLLGSSCTPQLEADVKREYERISFEVDYNLHVKPILSDKCFSCHGPDQAKRKAGLRLDVAEAAYEELPENKGKHAVTPGRLGKSEIFHRIVSEDPDYKMPAAKSNLTLSAYEKAILIRWIEQGAVYKPHWAFVKPESAEIPEVANGQQVINPIDNFILQKLENQNLRLSASAEKSLLLRRLSLDLTGLPPTISETETFLSDSSDDAYEKQVDRLIASPHFGEKMAIDWLELARFSDSHGYTVDRIVDMSPYRDWVIKSFNENMPYDQFIQWQLAGDLMPQPTRDMLIATGFNRIHQQNTEGGIIEEEFRTEYVVDRTNTTGVALMGLTLGCARCHDHKYDPVSQKNYYEIFAFFNNVREAGQIAFSDAMPSPTIILPTPEKEAILKYLKSEVTILEKEVKETEANEKTSFDQWVETKGYRTLAKEKIPANGLLAHFDFDQKDLRNHVNAGKPGNMMRGMSPVPGEKPIFEKNGAAYALKLNGDEWLDLGKIGVFRKSDPFSIALRVWIPKDFKEGVLFHKCIAERLFNYRGYHLYVRDNRFELSLSHTAPSDAITNISTSGIKREQWLFLTATYDGSGKASGLQLFIDGEAQKMETIVDQLQKDILLDTQDQPGLQIGAWDRGLGFKHGLVDDLFVYNRELTNYEVKVLAGKASWNSLANQEPKQLDQSERNLLNDYYLNSVSTAVKNKRQALKQKRSALADSTEQIQEYMVMQEMPVPRQAYILKRGSYTDPGEAVFPNTPEAIMPFPNDLPKNRLGLSKWLTDSNHPLTARVAVNRYWQNFFGNGLVKTAEDFGNQGEIPSHPELLDWLALRFQSSGWNVKALCKLMVMSATYRQNSSASDKLRSMDPENRLLARGPSQRLSAEMMRDNALSASGLLNEQIGGKSVKPYQPDGLWEINNTSYQPDTGSAVYRRSLYVLIKRSVPNPTLSTFDASSRSYCVIRRQQTNTPLQALVTLNDPTYVEAAKVLGIQITKEENPRFGITQAYRKLTGRAPTEKEIELLLQIRDKELTSFNREPKKIKGWISAGQYTVNNGLNKKVVAANAVVASIIMNSDATIMKR